MGLETVNTGGTTSFVYPKRYLSPRDKELDKNIDLAYYGYYK